MSRGMGRLEALAGALGLAVLALGVADDPAASAGPARRVTLKRSPPRAVAPASGRSLGATRRQPRSAPAPVPGSARTGSSRAFLIYLHDGHEPIVIGRYAEKDGAIVFEKHGGVVRIPTHEILKIVPDEPDRLANLPPPPVSAAPGGARLRPEPDLYVTMRGSSNLRVSGLTRVGDWVRVSMPNGSFTVPRSEIFGVVRVRPGSDLPEAWLSIRSTDALEDGAPADSAALIPTPPDPRLPYYRSDHPHLLRLANGALMRVEAFWVEEGEFRFRRLGGIVGVALHEVARLVPEEIVPVGGRTPVWFASRLAPDLMEVRVRSGPHHVRLVGVEPVNGTWTGEDPWLTLGRGTIVYLEFDRQRYDREGNWLAYVFLPDGRMLNAELIRLGLAQPRVDGRNVRYLDLFQELAGPDLATVPEPGIPDRDRP